LYDNKFAFQDVTGYGPFIFTYCDFVWCGTPLTFCFSKPKYVRAACFITVSNVTQYPGQVINFLADEVGQGFGTEDGLF